MPADSRGDWLTGTRSELAAGRILDVAERLFTSEGIESVTMRGLASAVGCSRATLYRYFSSKDELLAAYVDRAARELAAKIAQSLQHNASDVSPAVALGTAIRTAVDGVRTNPALATWFDADTAGRAGRIAVLSEAIESIADDFLASIDPDPPADDRTARARWLVRVVLSLLTTPAPAAEEAAMLDRFVIPVILPPVG